MVLLDRDPAPYGRSVGTVFSRFRGTRPLAGGGCRGAPVRAVMGQECWRRVPAVGLQPPD